MRYPNSIWSAMEESDLEAIKNDPRYNDYDLKTYIIEPIDYTPRISNSIVFSRRLYWAVHDFLLEYGFTLGEINLLPEKGDNTGFKLKLCAFGLSDNRIDILRHNHFLKQHGCMPMHMHSANESFGYIEIPTANIESVQSYLKENEIHCKLVREYECSSIYALSQDNATYIHQPDENGKMRIVKAKEFKFSII